MSDLIKSFVIGSSALIFVPFYIGVSLIPQNEIDLQTYAIKVALYFGTMNALATYVGKKYDLSLIQRLKLVTTISILILWSILTIYQPYNFKTCSRWLLQYIVVAVAHIITFLFIIYCLEQII